MNVSAAETNSNPGAPVVVLTNLTKQFGRFAALRKVSAEFLPGRLYAVLGENGAGKSTMLRAIAGLAHPSAGKVSVLGASSVRAVCHRIGYMAHPSLLYDEMSGLENLVYFGGLYDVHDAQRSVAAIKLVGLDPELTRPVSQYSQGMRQRMSLARSLVHDPELLLLDEPFSNVDVASAREMVHLLGKMRDGGKTIFVVTHQASLLAPVADEFVWMHAGMIEKRTAKLEPGVTQ